MVDAPTGLLTRLAQRFQPQLAVTVVAIDSAINILKFIMGRVF